MNTISLTRGSVSIGAFVAILAATVLSLSSVLASPVHASHQSSAGDDKGFTGGWYDGRTVDFFYNKDFFCKEPPASGADSDCVVGAEPETAPRGGRIPVLYVMTPIPEAAGGFTPVDDPATADNEGADALQCPTLGECINHPGTLDLSPVFGDGQLLGLPLSNFPLPPHSHIVDVDQGGWWEIEVVGVFTQEVWNEVVAGKDLATVRELQDASVGITGDIPSNLYLFFDVRD